MRRDRVGLTRFGCGLTLREMLFHARRAVLAIVLAMPFCLASNPRAQVMEIGPACGGMTMFFTGQPRIGTSMTLGFTGALPNAMSALFFGGEAIPLVGLDLLGITGCTLYVSPMAFASIRVAADGTGTWSHAFTLANDPGTIGITAVVQCAAEHPGANPLGVAISNAYRFTIQP